MKGIEGDYIETNDNLIFDVKGIHHPKDRNICFIRFFPDSEGDRLRNNIRYKKIYNLDERYSFLRKHYPQYLFFSKELDIELQGVKIEDIKKIYNPRDYFKKLSQKSDLTRLEQASLEICDLFISEGNLPKESIGITGSSMVGLSSYGSDIDLIIYGTETSLKFQEGLSDILNSCGFCRKYNSQEFLTHYEWRAGGSNIPYESFLNSEQRKLHQGMFKGFDFFIRYIKSPKDWVGNYYDYLYKDFGRIKLNAEILNATDSIFTPCSYKIRVKKILESDFSSDQINTNLIREINSFRGRFCEHSKDGEDVLVEGKLEKVTYKNSEEHFRIILNDQIKDKIIVIG